MSLLSFSRLATAWRRISLFSLVSVILLLNFLVFACQLYFLLSASPKLDEESSGYKRSSYPETYEGIDLSRPVSLTFNETTYYQLYGPQAAAEWQSMIPAGDGIVYIDPNREPFRLSMFHTLRCLDTIRMAIFDDSRHDLRVVHCFDYIRQKTLCSSDMTLEGTYPDKRLDPLGEILIDGLGVTRTCRDWTKVYAHLTGLDEGSES